MKIKELRFEDSKIFNDSIVDTAIGFYEVSLVQTPTSKYYQKWMVSIDKNIMCFADTVEKGKEYCVKDFTERVKACLIL